MAKRKDAIGFECKSMPDEVSPEKELEPPLVVPVYVDDVEIYELFQRYNLLLVPVSCFEYQLVQICAALEKRVRELDPDL